jgi:hypothetical protein
MIGSRFKNTRTFLRNFKEDDRGSMTVFGLFFFIASGILGAIALDVTSLYAERTHLQIAADQAAHAALYNYAIRGESEADSKTAAIAIVQATLPAGQYGVTIDSANIEFGVYDPVLDVFLPNAGHSAVRARTAYTDARGNSASAFLFRLIGIDTFEINTSAIFAEAEIECLNEGFVANGVVDMQNQNFFGAGFCIHSNTHVEIQPNNVFQLGSVVSMPGGQRAVQVPGLDTDGMTDDEVEAFFQEAEDRGQLMGLGDALADDTIDLRVFERLANMMYDYENPGAAETTYPYPLVVGDRVDWPTYIPVANRNAPTDLGALNTIDTSSLPAGLASGGVYRVGCTSRGNQQGTVTINSGDGIGGNPPPLTNVIIITSCNVSFGQGSIVRDARIISTSTAVDSFKAPSGLTLGGLDANGCDTGGAALITAGGMRFAANFSGYNSQMFTGESIKFAATPNKPNDFKGMSMIANDVIDMASHVNALVGCNPGGGGNSIQASYFNMVR